jgi:hypothetical protein
VYRIKKLNNLQWPSQGLQINNINNNDNNNNNNWYVLINEAKPNTIKYLVEISFCLLPFRKERGILVHIFSLRGNTAANVMNFLL